MQSGHILRANVGAAVSDRIPAAQGANCNEQRLEPHDRLQIQLGGGPPDEGRCPVEHDTRSYPVRSGGGKGQYACGVADAQAVSSRGIERL